MISKWTYRRVREPQSPKPDPVRVAAGRAYQTSRQLKRPFLCSQCEQLLGRSEKLAAELAVQTDDTFPFETLIGRSRGQVSEGVDIVEFSNVDRELLAYFALSVIWRCDVMEKWIDLGPAYREAIRKHLLADKFPDHVYVVLSMLRQAPGSFDLGKMVTSPITHRFPHYRIHAFAVCGLEFLVAVGRTAPTWVRDLCLHHAPSPLALRSTSNSSISAQRFVRSAAEALMKRTGRAG